MRQCNRKEESWIDARACLCNANMCFSEPTPWEMAILASKEIQLEKALPEGNKGLHQWRKKVRQGFPWKSSCTNIPQNVGNRIILVAFKFNIIYQQAFIPHMWGSKLSLSRPIQAIWLENHQHPLQKIRQITTTYPSLLQMGCLKEKQKTSRPLSTSWK